MDTSNKKAAIYDLKDMTIGGEPIQTISNISITFCPNRIGESDYKQVDLMHQENNSYSWYGKFYNHSTISVTLVSGQVVECKATNAGLVTMEDWYYRNHGAKINW